MCNSFNPLSEPVEGEEDTTGNIRATLTVNGSSYPSTSQTIKYSTFDQGTYTFEFTISNYEGELTSISPSAVKYDCSGSTDISSFAGSDANTTISITKQ